MVVVLRAVEVVEAVDKDKVVVVAGLLEVVGVSCEDKVLVLVSVLVTKVVGWGKVLVAVDLLEVVAVVCEDKTVEMVGVEVTCEDKVSVVVGVLEVVGVVDEDKIVVVVCVFTVVIGFWAEVVDVGTAQVVKWVVVTQKRNRNLIEIRWEKTIHLVFQLIDF